MHHELVLGLRLEHHREPLEQPPSWWLETKGSAVEEGGVQFAVTATVAVLTATAVAGVCAGVYGHLVVQLLTAL